MKRVVFLSLNLLWTTFVLAQVVNIPDANFKKALVSDTLINTNKDTEIQVSEAVVYTKDILVSNKGIVDLTGIEAFVNITSLDCYGNSLSTLNVSKNIALMDLECSSNKLTTLDVSNNVVLTHLNCYINKLSSLNISKNTALTYLDISYNLINNIDLSKNFKLNIINCRNNTIDSLNVSANIALEYLYCRFNKLKSLDFSKNKALMGLECSSNTLTTLDVSKNTSLLQLDCSINLLTYLNVKNGANNKLIYLSAFSNPQLKCIEVDNPNFFSSNWAIDLTATLSSNCMIPTKDISSEGFLQLYPNPSTDSFAFSDLTEAPLSVAIYDLHGKLVQHYLSPASNYDISTLCNGLYIVKAQFANGEAIAKLLKGE